MNKPVGLYRRVMRAHLAKLRAENKKLRERNKELESLSSTSQIRQRQLAEMEQLLIARSQHYDAQNPRIRHKIIKMRKSLLEHMDG